MQRCVRGLRSCVRVCTYASIPMYMCTCVRCMCVHVNVRVCVRNCARARLRMHTRPCVCVSGHMCVRLWAHVWLYMCRRMYVHVRACVGAHACAFVGVGQRTCGLCVRASL